LITGINYSNELIAKIYKNDGNGNFTEVTGAVLDGVFFSAVDFADIDGNNSQDLIIVGYNNSNSSIAKLYKNDGSGNFTEDISETFEGVHQGDVEFVDIDGDLDFDLVLTGFDNAFERITKLYENDGDGNFTEVPGVPFDAINRGEFAFADVDGDNDMDLLLTGWNGDGVIAKLYLNDGSGGFTEVANTPFLEVGSSSVVFEDVDGDTDLDVLISGHDGSNQLSINLYQNDGLGNFTKVTGQPFRAIQNGTLVFDDLDGDNDQDLLIIGNDLNDQPTGKFYNNLLYGSTVNSLEENNLSKLINIYPNPGNGAVNIQVEGTLIEEIKVHSALGKMVFHKKDIKSNTFQFELNQVSGVYFIEILAERQTKRLRFVKN